MTNMARQMVVNYGFSDIGPWSLLDPSAQSGDMIMRMMARNGTSESLQRRIDEAVKKIATEAYEVALSHIRCARCQGVSAQSLLQWCRTKCATCSHLYLSYLGLLNGSAALTRERCRPLYNVFWPGGPPAVPASTRQVCDPLCVVLRRRNNREAIDKIVELLQERETIDGKEFRDILSQYTNVPEPNDPAAKSAETVLA